jgi:hypothetical protein
MAESEEERKKAAEKGHADEKKKKDGDAPDDARKPEREHKEVPATKRPSAAERRAGLDPETVKAIAREAIDQYKRATAKKPKRKGGK